jgi:ABC-type multidrug transport system fused ATPase/permease subunit
MEDSATPLHLVASVRVWVAFPVHRIEFVYTDDSKTGYGSYSGEEQTPFALDPTTEWIVEVTHEALRHDAIAAAGFAVRTNLGRCAEWWPFWATRERSVTRVSRVAASNEAIVALTIRDGALVGVVTETVDPRRLAAAAEAAAAAAAAEAAGEGLAPVAMASRTCSTLQYVLGCGWRANTGSASPGQRARRTRAGQTHTVSGVLRTAVAKTNWRGAEGISLGLSLVCLFLHSACDGLAPVVTGRLITAVMQRGAAERILASVLAQLVALTVLSAAARVLSSYVHTRRAQLRDHELRRALFKRTIWQPFAFFDTRSHNALCELVTPHSTFGFLQHALAVVGAAVKCLVLVGVLASLSLKATLLTALFFPAYAILLEVFVRVPSEKADRVTQRDASMTREVVSESFALVRTVKLFSREAHHLARYDATRAGSADAEERAFRFGAFFAFAFSVFPQLVLCLVLYVCFFGSESAAAALSDAAEGVTVPGDAAAAAAAPFSSGSLAAFLLTYPALHHAFAAVEHRFHEIEAKAARVGRMLRFLSVDEDSRSRGEEGGGSDDTTAGSAAVAAGGTGIVAQGRCGCIELDAVSFSYATRPDVAVLRGLNLVLRPGWVVALCGRSGAGKSTVSSLVNGLHAPTAGRVLVDGVDLASLDLAAFHQRIATVDQSPQLFATTIRRNIAYGAARDDVSDAEVEAAARAANAYDFIVELPGGFDEVIDGDALSGGQKQRIAIARAILAKPELLILDEATSALDLYSEALVQSALDALVKDTGAAVLVIAHRLSTIRAADEIVVMERGAAIERGSHDALLLKKDGAYAALIRTQLGG